MGTDEDQIRRSTGQFQNYVRCIGTIDLDGFDSHLCATGARDPSHDGSNVVLCARQRFAVPDPSLANGFGKHRDVRC
jgi:hypothetical protein